MRDKMVSETVFAGSPGLRGLTASGQCRDYWGAFRSCGRQMRVCGRNWRSKSAPPNQRSFIYVIVMDRIRSMLMISAAGTAVRLKQGLRPPGWGGWQ